MPRAAHKSRYYEVVLDYPFRAKLKRCAKAQRLPVRCFAGLVIRSYLRKPFVVELEPLKDDEPTV